MQLKASHHLTPVIVISLSVLVHLISFFLFGLIDPKDSLNLVGQDSMHVVLANVETSKPPSIVESKPINEVTQPNNETIQNQESPIPEKQLVLKEKVEHHQVIASDKDAKEPVLEDKKNSPEAQPVKPIDFLSNKHLAKEKDLKPVKYNASPNVSEEVKETAVSMLDSSELTIQEENSPPRYQMGSAANPIPEYPMLARKKGWQGDLILGVHLNQDGSIKHLTFVKSTDYSVLNHAAYETVRTQWQFAPLEDENELENNYIEVPISFRFN